MRLQKGCCKSKTQPQVVNLDSLAQAQQGQEGGLTAEEAEEVWQVGRSWKAKIRQKLGGRSFPSHAALS